MPSWESVYWGWLKSYFSEIAAVCKVLDNIVKASPGADSPFPERASIDHYNVNRLRKTIEEKLPDPSIDYSKVAQVRYPAKY